MSHRYDLLRPWVSTNGAGHLTNNRQFPGNPLPDREWQEIATHFHLGRREREVLIAVHNGLSEQMIAAEFGISPHTVHAHLGNIFRKFAVTSRAALILYIFSWHTHVRLPRLLANSTAARFTSDDGGPHGA